MLYCVCGVLGCWGAGCGVRGVRYGVWGAGCGVRGVGCGVWGAGCGVRGGGAGCGVRGVGCWGAGVVMYVGTYSLQFAIFPVPFML